MKKVSNKEGRYYFRGMRDLSLIAAFSYAAAYFTGYTNHRLTPIAIVGAFLAFAALGHFFGKKFHQINPDKDSAKPPPPLRDPSDDLKP